MTPTQHLTSGTGSRSVSRGRLAALVAILVAGAGCILPVFAPITGSAGEVTPYGEPAKWRDCPEVARELVGREAPNMTYSCATVEVPRNWDTVGPNASANLPGAGETFEIALLRARSTKQTDRIGSLLINPGGPGGSGVDTAVYLSFGSAFGGVSEAVTERFDLIGFDPRGVARSSPVECIPDNRLDMMFGFEPDPRSEQDFDKLVTLNRSIGAECGDAALQLGSARRGLLPGVDLQPAMPAKSGFSRAQDAARHDVGRGARAEGHDHADGPVRESGGARLRRGAGGAEGDPARRPARQCPQTG